jgi:hypothetical protein
MVKSLRILMVKSKGSGGIQGTNLEVPTVYKGGLTIVQQMEPMAKGREKFQAGSVSFIVQHELWDGNLQDHSDQGVAILVVGQVNSKETTLLRGRQPHRLVNQADPREAP